jgi:hypothetical protein
VSALSGPYNFGVDTLDPAVMTVTPSLATITDANVGTADFSVKVTYSKPMNTTTAPTITFTTTPTGSLGGTLINNALSGWTTDSNGNYTIYTAVYTVLESGVSYTGVAIGITGATDTASPAETQVQYTGSNNFTVNTQNPVVTSVTPSTSIVTGGTFDVVITYSDSMNPTPVPTISFTPSLTSTLSFVSASSSWTTTSKYTAVYTVSGTSVPLTQEGIGVSGAVATYTQTPFTESNAFSIETQLPTVTGVTPSTTAITEANLGGTFSVTAKYSTPMNTAATAPAPAISFTPALTSSLTPDGAGWIDSTDYTAVYSVANADLPLTPVTVSISGATDVVGNTQQSFSPSTDYFSIDTRTPVVLSVSPSASVLTAASVGAPFTVTATYSSTMNTSIAPSISFSPLLTSTLSFVSASSGWTSSTQYTATYSVSDGNLPLTQVGIGIAGAQDTGNHTQTAYSGSDNFSVAMTNPTVTLVTPSTTLLTDANLGNGTFNLQVTYSVAMNTSGAPTISFSPALTGTLSLASGSWSSNGTQYTAVYNVANADLPLTPVTVSISGASDVAGNTQQAFSPSTDYFSVATAAATVTGVTPNLDSITLNTADVGPQNFTVTVSYSMPMNTSSTPAISFTPALTSSLMPDGANWIDSQHYQATYDVANAGVSVPSVGISVAGAVDASGNTQTPFSDTGDFSVDTLSPTCLWATPAPGMPTTLTNANAGQTFSIAIRFNKAMDTTVAPTVTLSAALNGTLTGGVGSWNAQGNQYTMSYSVANAGLSLSTYFTVSVSGAPDVDGNSLSPDPGTPTFFLNVQMHIPQPFTPGLFESGNSMFFMHDSDTPGPAESMFNYGPSGPHVVSMASWIPLVGDWNGTGVDTVGLYDPNTSTFYLHYTNAAGAADVTFVYGFAGSQTSGYLVPLVGDWTGSGVDTVGLYDPRTATFFLRDSNTPGPADSTFVYGPAGLNWIPLAGDWTGTGVDTVGLYDPKDSIFFLHNSNTGGAAETTFGYGPNGVNWTPLVGDWTGSGTTTVGLFNPGTSTFFLRNSNTPGAANETFGYGPAGANWTPLVGVWNAGGTTTLVRAGVQPALVQTLPALTTAQLQPVVGAAIARWAAAGLPAQDVAILENTRVVVGALTDGELGASQNGVITLDPTAAGQGWFVDPTPNADEEFTPSGTDGALTAIDPRAVDRIDLLTVVEHELGNVLGLKDTIAATDSLMDATLSVGIRRTPDAATVAALLEA